MKSEAVEKKGKVINSKTIKEFIQQGHKQSTEDSGCASVFTTTSLFCTTVCNYVATVAGFDGISVCCTSKTKTKTWEISILPA